MTDKQKKTNSIPAGIFFAWLFGLIFILSSMVSLFSKPLTGILTLLTGIALLPPFWRFARKSFGFAPSLPIKALIIIVLLVVNAMFGDHSSTSSNTDSTDQQTGNTTVSDTPTPIVNSNIVVTSKIVKKVAPTTYRYFFDIENKDSNPFMGDIVLQIYNGHDTPTPLIFGGGSQSFSDDPIPAGLHKIVYVDDSHAPFQVDGIDGASTFSYNLNDSDSITGKGDIAGYEDDLQLQY